jgi:hypothetical protein
MHAYLENDVCLSVWIMSVCVCMHVCMHASLSHAMLTSLLALQHTFAQPDVRMTAPALVFYGQNIQVRACCAPLL